MRTKVAAPPRLGIALVFVFGAILVRGLTSRSEDDIQDRHRLYDMAPASVSNPVVARVKDCAIEITVNEFKAYVEAQAVSTEEARQPMNSAAKRSQLEQLLNEHFLLWDGYQQKGDESEGVARILNDNLKMALQEALSEKEAGAKAKTGEEYNRLMRELRDRLFEESEVTISDEANAELKEIVKRAVLESPPKSTKPTFRGVTPEMRERVLAQCKLGTVSIGDVLAAFDQIPSDSRPDLATRDGLVTVLKYVMRDALLIAEARERGYEELPEVQAHIQLSRNVLTRMYALDQITSKVVARTKEPEHAARVKQWYEDHLKDRYTVKDSDGTTRVVSLESEKKSIENDYFEFMREEACAQRVRLLREGHQIEYNFEALELLAL
jgi:hypothetical protein